MSHLQNALAAIFLFHMIGILTILHLGLNTIFSMFTSKSYCNYCFIKFMIIVCISLNVCFLFIFHILSIYVSCYCYYFCNNIINVVVILLPQILHSRWFVSDRHKCKVIPIICKLSYCFLMFQERNISLNITKIWWQ